MIEQLIVGVLNLSPGMGVMMCLGGLLVYLAIARGYEPLLLLPIGFGIMLTNIPATGLTDEGGFFWLLKTAGLDNELFPLIMFLGLGALTDFEPLLANPKTVLLGAAAQLGIFGAMMAALFLGFPLNEAASIGIVGSADGPTTIYVSTQLAPEKLWGPVAVAAYSYMAMVPVIQPPIMRMLTTRKERLTRMDYSPRPVSKMTKLLFPVITAMVVGVIAPKAAPLIGLLMFGNLMRESGVVDRLSKTAQNELININTIFLGLAVGSTMTATRFLDIESIQIFVLGLLAFAISTVAGVLFGKLMYYLTRGKINPLIGGAGVSAVPMAARVVQRVANEEDPNNFLLMQAMGPNVAGVIGSAIAGGVLLGLLR